MEFDFHQAKEQFAKLLDLVQAGEEVIIVRNGSPVVELIPARKPTAPQWESAAILPAHSQDWWKTEGEEESGHWYGK